MNTLVNYNMVSVNFLFKEVYSLESIFRIIGIICDSGNHILKLLLEKEKSLINDLYLPVTIDELHTMVSG